MSSIYFIACPATERVKIGFTNGSVEARIKALQTGSSSRLLLMAVQPGSIEDEQALHCKYAEHRVHGEWFTVCEDLFKHMTMLVWFTAVDCQMKGSPIPRWVQNGLISMNGEGPLPPHMLEILEASLLVDPV